MAKSMNYDAAISVNFQTSNPNVIESKCMTELPMDRPGKFTQYPQMATLVIKRKSYSTATCPPALFRRIDTNSKKKFIHWRSTTTHLDKR